ncbi:hypothetical protein GQ457_12G032780 [Hibiscus cannabinus]
MSPTTFSTLIATLGPKPTSVISSDSLPISRLVNYKKARMGRRELDQKVNLFVDNLPKTLHWQGLWHIFARHGDVYIARKLNTRGQRFGFVRFEKEVDASRAVERLNGLSIHGNKISVSMRVIKVGSWRRKERVTGIKKPRRIQGHVEVEELWKMKRQSLVKSERVTWLEITGMPLHCWNHGSFKRVVRLKHLGIMLFIQTIVRRFQSIGLNEMVVELPKPFEPTRIKSSWEATIDALNNVHLATVESTYLHELSGTLKESEGFFPELVTKHRRVKKYGSLLDFQDKAISERDRKKRNRAIKKDKKLKKVIEFSELSGRSLSDSDLTIRWNNSLKEARKTLDLGKSIGFHIVGDESEAVRDLALLEWNQTE